MKTFSRKLGKWIEFRDWTEEDVALLLALRAEGKSTNAISKRLDRSPGSVQRKVKRMGLTPKQSPIHRVSRAAPTPEPEPESEREAYGAEPLPAGHPISWEAIAIQQEAYGV